MKIINSRLFKVLVLLFLVGLFLGIMSFFIIKDKSSIINYLYLIKNGNINYIKTFISILINNYKYALIIWIFGIIFIISFIIPFIIIFRGIFIGFTLFSIIIAFKLKGLLIALIILFPSAIINEFIYILLSYYSINFSNKMFDAYKNNKSINIRSFSINYLYIFLILISILLLTTLFETYISSNIVKFVI